MTTDEMVAGLREYAEAKEAWNSRDDFEQGCDTENLSRFSKAVMFMTDHASAIADELEMLSEEAKHLKPLVESTLEENERLKRKADAFDLFMGCVDAVKDAEPSDVVNALLDKVKENSRLRAEVERMKEVGRHILDHYLKQCYDCDGIPDEAWAHTEVARALFPARDAGEVEGGK